MLTNRWKSKSLFLLICLCNSVCAENIALSFDDGFNPLIQIHAEKLNEEILNSLSEGSIQSILYVAGKNVDNDKGLQLIEDWSANGHLIANHSYSHFNFNSNNITLQNFIADVKKNEFLLRGIPNWTKRFRFPYLKEGNTSIKRDIFRKWLIENGYNSGAVSIDASDWFYNKIYLCVLRQNVSEELENLRRAYLAHLWERANYYNSLSKKLYNRSIDHVLLLHVNAINAAFLPDVIDMFHSKGWNIITPSKAYDDPIYSITPEVLPAGESILWSLAKQKKVKNLRYPAEDSQYEINRIEEFTNCK